MNQPNNKKYLISIAVLTVALVAAIGWIVYGQLNSQKANQASEKTSQSAEEKQTSDASLTSPTAALTKKSCLPLEKICLNHPGDWTVEFHKPATTQDRVDYKREKMILSSPDGQVFVGLDAGITGIGGVCMPDDTHHPDLTVSAKYPTTISGYGTDNGKSDKLFVIETIEKDNVVPHKFTASLQLNRAAWLASSTLPKKLEACQNHMEGMIIGRNSVYPESDNTPGLIYVDFGATKPKDINDHAVKKTFNTYDEAKAYLDSETVKTARLILTTASY